MSNPNALRHMAMGDSGDHEEKRDPARLNERELAQQVLDRIHEAQNGDKLSTYEARILSTLFRSAIRRDDSIDSEENQRLLGLIRTDDGSVPALVDVDKLPPHEEQNRINEGERRLRDLSEFFDDLKAYRDDEDVPQTEKDLVRQKLEETIKYYQTAVEELDEDGETSD